jgi:hypothetical protein
LRQLWIGITTLAHGMELLPLSLEISVVGMNFRVRQG